MCVGCIHSVPRATVCLARLRGYKWPRIKQFKAQLSWSQLANALKGPSKSWRRSELSLLPCLPRHLPKTAKQVPREGGWVKNKTLQSLFTNLFACNKVTVESSLCNIHKLWLHASIREVVPWVWDRRSSDHVGLISLLDTGVSCT